MFSFFKKLFGIVETDLNKILASFDRTLADLELHLAHHEAAEATKKAEAAEALKLAAEHATAAAQATTVRDNLKHLLGK